MWGYNKPNNYGGYQTCVVMHRGVGYKFDDDRCGQTAATYICELSNNTIHSAFALDQHVRLRLMA